MMNSPGVKRPLPDSGGSAELTNGAKKKCATPSILNYFAPKPKITTTQDSPGTSPAYSCVASSPPQSKLKALAKPLSTVSEQQQLATPTATKPQTPNPVTPITTCDKTSFMSASKVLASVPPCTPPRAFMPNFSRPTPGSSGKFPSVKGSHQDPSESSIAAATPVTHAHVNYKFLMPEYRRDIDMRLPDNPDYDEKTLYVPPEFMKNCTPALRQWWTIKQRNMDAILFFKMGKFYELFNEDAVVGVNHVNLIYMKADDDKPAHAGFPEQSFQKYADLLIQKGFKVMRIEQTETPAMLDERARTQRLKSSDRVVMREVCQVTTRGTRMFGISETVFQSAQNQYLLALTESSSESVDGERPAKVFGVCFVDVTIGTVHIGQFEDDNNLSNLNILLAHHTPTEVIHERNGLSTDTLKSLLKTGARIDSLKANKEFWPIKKAISHLKLNRIFSGESGNFEWPSCLKSLFQAGDASTDLMSLDPLDQYKLALNSFGAIVYYLNSQFIEKQVLACLDMKIYNSPLSRLGSSKGCNGATKDQSDLLAPMVMDHIALKNLEVFTNSSGLTNATLFASINHCQTHFGERLLKNWICSPLCDPRQINNRLDAVEALMSNLNASLMNEIVHMLNSTPDLERYLSKIKNHCFKSEGDTRAVMFDGNVYNKAKVNAFINLNNNFKRVAKFINSISLTIKNCESSVLRRLLSLTTDGGLYPDYTETLDYFDASFDSKSARDSGEIIPTPGVNKNYDECEAKITRLNEALYNYLEEQKSSLRCNDIGFFGTGKNRYQLQVPEVLVKKIPDDWRLESGRKGYKRYYTPFIDKHFTKLTIYEDQRKRILDDVLSNLFEQFLRKTKLWSAAIECIAIVDVLQSIAKFARSLKANGIDMCRPTFVDNANPLILEYTNGRHPVLVKLDSSYVSNDLKLDDRTLLLSGANMGGKSTIMRQTALLVILAQIGCYVPASSLKLTPVDRIFSRLGASDRLLEGESTFFTELVETSAMLRCATVRSLLLLDELGRGTSTFDGTAIAYAVMKEISANLKCRCIFSTHYHTLTRDFMHSQNVRLAHMACKIEREESEDDDASIHLNPLKENITFLYKITDGPAARSYGYNVAKLAGIQYSIISEAYSKSKEIELACKVMGTLQSICAKESVTGNLPPLKHRVLSELATA